MTDFKAKMHQIRFRLGGSLQRSLRLPSWIWGRFTAGGGAGLGKRRERGGEGEGGEVEGRGKEGPKLLLNQGPSEPCYATVYVYGNRHPTVDCRVANSSAAQSDVNHLDVL